MSIGSPGARRAMKKVAVTMPRMRGMERRDDILQHLRLNYHDHKHIIDASIRIH
jgi:hypothetical protein